MSSLGSLVVSLAMDTARFTSDIGKAGAQMEKLQKSAAKMGAAAGAAITAAGAALGYMVKQSIDAADAASKMAQSLGLSTEEMTRLQYAAGMSGVENEALSTGLSKLAKTAADAASGSGAAADAFRAIGVDVKDAAGNLRPMSELVAEVSEKFSTYEDSAAKTALAQEFFGKSGAKMIPFLNAGKSGLSEMAKESDLLGATLSTKAGKEAEAFNDNLSRLKLVATGAANTLASELLPGLAGVTTSMVEAAKESSAFREQIAVFAKALSYFTIPLEALVVFGANVGYTFTQLGKDVVALSEAFDALETGGFTGAKNVLFKRGQDAEDARKKIDAFSESVLKAGEMFRKSFDKSATGVIQQADYSNEGRAYAAKIAAPAVAAAEKIKGAKETIEKQLQGIRQAYQGSLGDLRADFANEASEAASRMGSLSWADDQDEAARIFKATRTPAEEYAAALENINRLKAQGAFFGDTYQRAIAAEAEKFKSAMGSMQTDVEKFTESARENIQKSLGDQLFSAMQGKFSDIGQAFTQMLQRIIAEAAAANITKWLFGSGGNGSGGSSIGSWIATAGKFLGFFADGAAFGGGVVNTPTAFATRGGVGVMGEAGPEAVMPLVRGADGRLGVQASGGGAPSVTNVYNVSTGVTRGELVSALQLMAGQLRGETEMRFRRAGMA